jgi:WD40 repeat protein
MKKVLILIFASITIFNSLLCKNKDIAWIRGGNPESYYADLSPHGKYILTVSNGAKIWSVETGEQLLLIPNNLRVYSEYIYAFSTDDNLLYFADSSGINCFNIPEESIVKKIYNQKGIINTFALSEDEKILVCGASDSTLAVYDLENTSKVQTLIKLPDIIWKVGFTDNERYIVANGNKKSFVIENNSAKIISEFKYNNVTYSKIGKIIAASTGKKKNSVLKSCIGLYDIFGKHIRDFKFSEREEPREFLLSDSGNYLVTCSEDKFIKIYSTIDSSVSRTIKARVGVPITISHNEESIISRLNFYEIGIWDFKSGELKVRISDTPGSGISHIKIPVNDSYLLSVDYKGMLQLRNPTSGQIIRTFTNHIGAVQEIVCDDQNRNAASYSRDGRAIVWSVSDGKTLYNLEVPTLLISHTAFSHDGKYLLTYASRTIYDPGSEEGNYRTDSTNFSLWDVQTGSLLREYNKGKDWPSELVFSEDDKSFVGIYSATLKKWEINSGKLLIEYKLSYGSDCISPGINYLIKYNHPTGGITCWDVMKQKLLFEKLAHSGFVRTASWSQDEKTLITTGQDDNSLIVWEIPNGKAPRVFKLNIPRVHEGSVSPDGKYYAGGGTDGMVTIWDVSNGNVIRSYRDYPCYVSSIKWSQDEKFIFTGYGDGTIVAWRTNL